MKKLLFALSLLIILPMAIVANAVPPIERLPIYGITVSGINGQDTLKSHEQVTIGVQYTINRTSAEYVVIFRVVDENNQTVLLSWIEGSPTKSQGQLGSYVCGDQICFDKWAIPESYVCGNELCQDNNPNTKFVNTSWLPSESGKYEITVFAWESLTNPTALSPTVSIEVNVEN